MIKCLKSIFNECISKICYHGGNIVIVGRLIRKLYQRCHEQSFLMSTFVHGRFVLSLSLSSLDLFHARKHKISAMSNTDIYLR